MSQRRVVRVSGLPARRYEEDLLLDKLYLHFLRRSNGGDGEVHVTYPTEEEGVAMLTFDRPEVADRVLTRGHQLEIRGSTYPLTVSRPQLRGTQFLFPVTASLDVVHFGDTSEVRRILEKHNLNVLSEERFRLHVEGDFQDLSRCREELYQTLSDPPASRRPHAENRMSRRDKYHPSEPAPENDRAPGEEARVKTLNAHQSPANRTRPKTSERNPSPRRTLQSLPPDIGSGGSTGEKKRTPSIKPPLTQINSSAGSGQRKAKERSSDDSTTSTTSQPRSKMAANLNFHPVAPNKTSADESERREERGSPLVSGGRLGSHVAITGPPIGGDLPDARQPKGTTRDASKSGPKHHTSTVDSSYLNPGHPNSKQPKSTSSGKHQTSSVDGGLYLNPSNPVTSSSSSSHSSSLVAAGWSSSSSAAAVSSRSYLNQRPLSTDFLVDAAVHTYVTVFVKDVLDGVLGQFVEMKGETCDGYNRVILTAKSPDHSETFYKASAEVKDVFMKCERLLRVERIDLSNMSADPIKKLRTHLYSCNVLSLVPPKKAELEIIGPSSDILSFMEKWKVSGGDFETFFGLIQRGTSPASSRPPAVGMDNVHPSATHNNDETREGRRMRDRSQESGAGRDRRRPDSKSRSNTPNSRPRR